MANIIQKEFQRFTWRGEPIPDIKKWAASRSEPMIEYIRTVKDPYGDSYFEGSMPKSFWDTLCIRPNETYHLKADFLTTHDYIFNPGPPSIPPDSEKIALVKKLMDDAVAALAREYYKVEPIQPPTPAQSSIAKFASGLQLDDDEDF